MKKLKKERDIINLFKKDKDELIAVVIPPLVHPDNLDLNKKFHTLIPLGQLYIGAAVDRVDGYHSHIIDLNLQMVKNANTGYEYSLEYLVDSIPDVYEKYLIGCMFSSSAEVYYETCKLIKQRGKEVIVGGIHATAMSDYFYNNNLADIVIQNEGEFKITHYLIHNNLNVERVVVPPDIIDQFKKINIDDYNKYGNFGHSIRAFAKGRKTANLQHNRGCRGSCCFCSVRSIMGKGVRTIDINQTLREIDYLYNECGVRHIDWVDDDLFANKEVTIDLFNRIAKRDYDLTFSMNNAALAINIDKELVESVRDAKFIHMGFGIETPNKKIRKEVNKAGSIKNLKYTIDLFNEYAPDVFIHCNYMYGFPNETIGQILETWKWATDSKTDWSQFSIVQLLPNTPLFDECNTKDERLETTTRYTPASDTKNSKEDIIDFFEYEHNYIPTIQELYGMWYLINYRVNILDRKTIGWKQERFIKALLEVYPNDIILKRAVGIYEKPSNTFWQTLFNVLKKYDTMNRLGDK